uniref:Zinc finger FYVE domain-containing protein 1-like n=1 Tax=Sinocyclocheilus rhinocerous TaxID=307959 RepID=A0A673IDQ2_9TELE
MSEMLLKDMEEISLGPVKIDEQKENGRSFLLVDENESLQVKNEAQFLQKLGCSAAQGVKVLSIFGNTGDGKSHTLNHVLFDGEEVFATSPSPSSCTVGVWAAYEPLLNLIVLDTEGLLGAASQQNRRMRLLLKVLAVSDVAIYRTRAERLHNDMFQFLGSASAAYLKHFTPELRALSSRCGLDVPLSSLGPAVIVFQETFRTQLLGQDDSVLGQADTLLQKRFHDLGQSTDAFSSVQYMGTQTITPPTDYSQLLQIVNQQVNNTSQRAPRQPAIVFSALQALSDRFCGEISDDKISICSFFPDEYFTCPSVCLSCNYVLECPSCGIIYRSRQYWMGNQDPESSVVRPEVKHVWQGTDAFQTDHQNAAQRVLDGMTCIIQSVTEYSSGPTKAVTAWLTDQVAPPYWKPNAEIVECHGCKRAFEEAERKHHCRACGEGFCQACSTHSMPVPERGWGGTPVRVCDACYQQGGPQHTGQVAITEPRTLVARRVTEVAQSTLDMVSTAVDYPLCFVKGVARPGYWIPDHEITQCHSCAKPFTPSMPKHHCRACGKGVCGNCSTKTRPVPSRGWDHPVRVCDGCADRRDSL